MLRECEIEFEILQEYSEGGKVSRAMLGNVKVNLAEYVDAGHEADGTDTRESGEEREGIGGGGDDDDMIIRRYLMQDSKINSTLRIGIRMRQLEGDTSFNSPPLKSAMVFGGIAGVLSAQETTGEGLDDSGGYVPRTTSRTRELSEMQDLYRQVLATSWSRAADDMPPDKLIENIFDGGDGGAMKPPPPPAITTSRANPSTRHDSPRPDDDSETDRRRTTSHRHRFWTPHIVRRGQDLGKVPSPHNSSSNSNSNSNDENDDDDNVNHGYGDDRSRPRRTPHSTSGSGSGSGNGNDLNRSNIIPLTTTSSSSAPPTSTSTSVISGRQSLEQQMHHHLHLHTRHSNNNKHHDHSRRKKSVTASGGGGTAAEVSEVQVRGDLRSWVVKPRER